jgi:hypothetical protein
MSKNWSPPLYNFFCFSHVPNACYLFRPSHFSGFSLRPYSRILLEKRIVAHSLKILSTCSCARKFIIVLRKAATNLCPETEYSSPHYHPVVCIVRQEVTQEASQTSQNGQTTCKTVRSYPLSRGRTCWCHFCWLGFLILHRSDHC